MIDIRALLPFAVAPVAGAVIGFVTNMLAIKMLFRPLHKKYIFGIPVPLTPGIIPRQRRQLARAIGKMVSRELINEQTLLGYVDNPAVREKMEAGIASFTRKGMQTSLAEISPKINGLLKRLFGVLEGLASNDENNERIRKITGIIVEGGVSYVYSRPLSRKGGSAAPGRIETQLIQAFVSPSVEKRVAGFLTAWAESEKVQRLSLNDILGPGAVEMLIRMVDSAYYDIVSRVISWLRSGPVFGELVSQGSVILKDILKQFSGVQRFIISAGQFDKTLHKKMPGIMEGLVFRIEEKLSTSASRKEITARIHQALRGMTDKPVASIASYSGRSTAELSQFLVGRLFSLLRVNTGTGAVSLWSALTGTPEPTAGEVAEVLTGLDKKGAVEKLTAMITGYMDDADRRKRTAARVLYAADMFAKRNPDATLSSILRIDKNMKAEMDTIVLSHIGSLVKRVVPRVLGVFDIEKMVINRIDNLAVVEVERLLLMVIKKHLKWINVFGAILGFFIGIIQIFLNFPR